MKAFCFIIVKMNLLLFECLVCLTIGREVEGLQSTSLSQDENNKLKTELLPTESEPIQAAEDRHGIWGRCVRRKKRKYKWLRNRFKRCGIPANFRVLRRQDQDNFVTIRIRMPEYLPEDDLYASLPFRNQGTHYGQNYDYDQYEDYDEDYDVGTLPSTNWERMKTKNTVRNDPKPYKIRVTHYDASPHQIKKSIIKHKLSQEYPKQESFPGIIGGSPPWRQPKPHSSKIIPLHSTLFPYKPILKDKFDIKLKNHIQQRPPNKLPSAIKQTTFLNFGKHDPTNKIHTTPAKIVYSSFTRKSLNKFSQPDYSLFGSFEINNKTFSAQNLFQQEGLLVVTPTSSWVGITNEKNSNSHSYSSHNNETDWKVLNISRGDILTNKTLQKDNRKAEGTNNTRQHKRGENSFIQSNANKAGWATIKLPDESRDEIITDRHAVAEESNPRDKAHSSFFKSLNPTMIKVRHNVRPPNSRDTQGI